MSDEDSGPSPPDTPEPGPDPGEPVQYPAALVRRVAAISAVTGGLCAAGLWVSYGPASALSALLGALLGVLNLWALARLVVALLGDSETSSAGSKARAAVLLGAKSIGLVTLIGVLVVNGYVRGGALMAGLSTVALSIVIASVWPEGKKP